MKFHAIDRANWSREETYRHFTRDVPCTYSLVTQLDITNLRHTAKAAGVKVYPALVYMVVRAVNAHPEFRMDIVDGELGYYDAVDPFYTVFHADSETFSSIWTEYDVAFHAFYERYLVDFARYGDVHKLEPKPGGGRNLINISSLPWLSINGLNLNIQGGFEYFLPIFTFGKFLEERERTLLPLAIQVHHAVADGFHTARLIADMQAWADDFSLRN
jgi:chloramphenicol O-acetyltransferase type A